MSYKRCDVDFEDDYLNYDFGGHSQSSAFNPWEFVIYRGNCYRHSSGHS